MVLNSTERTDFKLFDLTGKLVKGGTFHNRTNKLKLSGLQPGVYYLRIQNSEQHYKIIKQ